MVDSELEKIREKKASQAVDEEKKLRQLQTALARMLEPDAYSRLMIVKNSNQNVYAQCIKMITYLQQKGQINGRITDEQLKKLLIVVAGTKKEPKIIIKRNGIDEGIKISK